MHTFIPRLWIAYVEAAVAGLTLGGDALYVEVYPGEGSLLLKDDPFFFATFAFPDAWRPPQWTPSPTLWLRGFFEGVTLNGHALVVGEEEGVLCLKEVVNERECYPWIVTFAHNWASPQPRAMVLDARVPLPTACEREMLVELLGVFYGMTPQYLADLKREQLVPLINLAPDIPGILIQQRWMYRRPQTWWQRLGWEIFGTPMAWRFEVSVMSSWSWQYAVRDTLEEAREAAWEAYRRLGLQFLM